MKASSLTLCLLLGACNRDANGDRGQDGVTESTTTARETETGVDSATENSGSTGSAPECEPLQRDTPVCDTTSNPNGGTCRAYSSPTAAERIDRFDQNCPDSNGAEFRPSSRCPEAAIGWCIRNLGEDDELTDHFYPPFSPAAARSACLDGEVVGLWCDALDGF